jgi:hypothetical protein
LDVLEDIHWSLLGHREQVLSKLTLRVQRLVIIEMRGVEVRTDDATAEGISLEEKVRQTRQDKTEEGKD